MNVLRGMLLAILPRAIHPALTRLYFKIRSPFYLGSKVHCPCCDRTFRKFARFEQSMQCPRCGSLERQRLLWIYLNSETDLFQRPLKLLHFAPEAELKPRFIRCENIQYTTADLYSPLVDVRTDIMDLVFEDCSFDVALCSHVLDHVDDDRKAMQEIARVLKPTGWLILQSSVDTSRNETKEDPQAITPQQRERAYGRSDLARLYGLDIVQRLTEAGFEVRSVDYASQLSAEVVRRSGLEDRTGIYHCTKKLLPES
ncbi:MAG: methyltransferase domain-containing protein [Planctomycetales bacterium]